MARMKRQLAIVKARNAQNAAEGSDGSESSSGEHAFEDADWFFSRSRRREREPPSRDSEDDDDEEEDDDEEAARPAAGGGDGARWTPTRRIVRRISSAGDVLTRRAPGAARTGVRQTRLQTRRQSVPESQKLLTQIVEGRLRQPARAEPAAPERRAPRLRLNPKMNENRPVWGRQKTHINL